MLYHIKSFNFELVDLLDTSFVDKMMGMKNTKMIWF